LQTLDYNLLSKRLEILKNAIAIKDSEDIDFQLNKLLKVLPSDFQEVQELKEVSTIITHIQMQSYGEAARVLTDLLTKFSSLTVYIDPEISGLKLETESLELKISSLQDEKADLEKLIYDFEVRHNRELGDIILQILILQRQIAEKEAKQNPKSEEKQRQYQEAKQDYENYQQNFEQAKIQKSYTLSEELKEELKANYRKASKLCHPDVVPEGRKEAAEKIFVELKNAYDENDLKKVNELLDYLEKGKPFSTKHETISDKEKLKITIIRLRQILNELIKQIDEIKIAESYQQISQIDDWNTYFKTTKEDLIKELERLQGQSNHSTI
jgi:hypothetical protein